MRDLILQLSKSSIYSTKPHETAAKHSARVCINSVPHTVDIHLPHPEITL
ncbi:DUF5431 family protein [Klebsiella quasipneumoniae subsp. similipneumoniae]|nr:DUF5431 family protein [Klebsiella quasipneumoniae]MDV0653299.1 DUF5431 family protein [Klebsiella quasipneumoniae subsp. similipneumoniae]